MDNLNSYREQINKLDSKIVKLLNERVGIAKLIGALKNIDNKGKDFYHPQREFFIFDKLKQLNDQMDNNKNISFASLYSIYKEIISACLGAEKTLNIGFLGPKGTYSHLAAQKNFGSHPKYVSFPNLEETFRAVVSKEVNYALVPIENSTEGTIGETIDLFGKFSVVIKNEVQLPIVHCLLANNKIAFKNIIKVFSHMQSFGQCRKWLSYNLPHAELVPVGSNSFGAKKALENENTAAIASSLAQNIYNLQLLQKNIADQPDNVTRFFVIGTQKNSSPYKLDNKKIANKTALIIAGTNHPGLLFDIISPFKKYNVDLTCLQSRPNKDKLWGYTFYIEFMGNEQEQQVKQALDLIAQKTSFFKNLGSFPC